MYNFEILFNINKIIENFIRFYQNLIIKYPEFSFVYIFTPSFYKIVSFQVKLIW